MAKHGARDRPDEEVIALAIEDADEARFEDDDQLDDPEFAITFTPDPSLRRAVSRRVLH